MNENTKYWDQLKRVPEEHLKGFTRGGGFRGTAIKPMWTFHRMTELFGPCGEGWGYDAPNFRIVEAGDEIMVYCTVSVWYGNSGHGVFGVGGDKVRAQSPKDGSLRSDDEAFKKAFTDALTNACKMLGAGADIHMGLWDGNKYVDEPSGENGGTKGASKAQNRGEYTRLSEGIKLIRETGTIEDLRSYFKNNDAAIRALPADWYEHLIKEKDEAKDALAAKVAA